MKTKRRIQAIRRTFTYRRFQIIAALSVGLFLTVAFALPGPLKAQTTGTANLTVRVTGARNAKGEIRVALFRDGKGFPNDASQGTRRLPSPILASVSWRCPAPPAEGSRRPAGTGRNESSFATVVLYRNFFLTSKTPSLCAVIRPTPPPTAS